MVVYLQLGSLRSLYGASGSLQRLQGFAGLESGMMDELYLVWARRCKERGDTCNEGQ